MQDRYAGDIGDFGKFGLLCRLADKFSIGINWYNPGELDYERDKSGSFKNKDGKYRDFSIVEKWNDKLAKELAEKLGPLRNNPSIKELEKIALIKGAVYYGGIDIVPRESKARKAWHKVALDKLENCDIVFLDPDNGLLCNSVKEGTAKSVKYTYYDEVKEYLKRGKSVIIYNHRCRKKENVYLNEIICKLCGDAEAERSRIQVISFRRFTVRDYFIISKDDDTHRKIAEILEAMVKSEWGAGTKSFCTLCDIGVW